MFVLSSSSLRSLSAIVTASVEHPVLYYRAAIAGTVEEAVLNRQQAECARLDCAQANTLALGIGLATRIYRCVEPSCQLIALICAPPLFSQRYTNYYEYQSEVIAGVESRLT